MRLSRPGDGVCLLCVRERDGMMWHGATDIVIHQPSFQVRLERLYGAALASTLPQVQIDCVFFEEGRREKRCSTYQCLGSVFSVYVSCSFCLSFFLSLSYFFFPVIPNVSYSSLCFVVSKLPICLALPPFI